MTWPLSIICEFIIIIIDDLRVSRSICNDESHVFYIRLHAFGYVDVVDVGFDEMTDDFSSYPIVVDLKRHVAYGRMKTISSRYVITFDEYVCCTGLKLLLLLSSQKEELGTRSVRLLSSN